MIIHSAEFENLHGHLSLALEFRPDVNVLIGINGTGKTSVLNAMTWILSPMSMHNGIQAAYWLSEFEFDQISLTYSESIHNKHRTAKARRFEDYIAVSVSDMKGEFRIPALPLSELSYGRRNRFVEATEALEKEVFRQRYTPVLDHLNSLQTPLYLPLNRRWMEEWETSSYPLQAALNLSLDRRWMEEWETPISRRYPPRSTQALTGTPVTEILTLAERAYRSEQAEIAQLNDKLRSNMLATLFDVGESSFIDTVPPVEEVTRQRQAIVYILDSLHLDDVKHLSEMYFDQLKEIAVELGGRKLPGDFHTGSQADAWWKWIREAASLAGRIEKLMQLIEDYQKKREWISRHTASFLQSVNDFLHDKRMVFSPEAELKVELSNGKQVGGHHLSSGEMQILTLFAFLHFQPRHADQSFVVLVDEPELSLHVAWQHRYVDSIRDANPNGQLIVATHSPEIAGSVAEESIIDMGEMVVAHA